MPLAVLVLEEVAAEEVQALVESASSVAVVLVLDGDVEADPVALAQVAAAFVAEWKYRCIRATRMLIYKAIPPVHLLSKAARPAALGVHQLPFGEAAGN